MAARAVRTYTNFTNGQIDRAGLDVELDIPVNFAASPGAAGYVRVWGVSLRELSSAGPDLNGKNVKVYGGMQKGLPLANPSQAGLLIAGTIFQAFGNWTGTSQSLDMYFGPAAGTPEKPANIVFNWQKGTPLMSAITSTMTTAFRGYKVTGSLGPGLVLPHDEKGYYHSVEEFATYIKQLTKSIVGGDYAGVDLLFTDQACMAYDRTSPTAPKMIAFRDLIGQPTYSSPGEIVFSTPMRADLRVADFIKMPTTSYLNTPEAVTRYNDQTTFVGAYFINTVRHLGHLRQPDGGSWCTVITANTAPPATAAKLPPSSPSSPGSPNPTPNPSPSLTVGPGGIIAGPV